MKSLLKLLFVILLATQILGHAILVLPPPRYGTNQTPGAKITPYSDKDTQAETCGSGDPGAGRVTATYQAGTQIVVTWDTTITHTSAPGVRIAIKYSSTDKFADNILAQGLEIGANGLHNATVTLPAGKTSDNAVLQWIWQSSSDGGSYIGCSDVKVQSGVVSTSGYTYPTGPTTGNGGDSGSTTSEASEVYARAFLLFLVPLVMMVLF
eukprot:TRINITY_DN13_c0_g1_i1.p1 TRINITY_DN13_c0_g1~~TRINITY_DN13_c0_g1_i1.p1  ORF type:complete len:209 (-),score=44.69 TRINITY_DN13_c0_g1_i1:119-745(-)